MTEPCYRFNPLDERLHVALAIRGESARLLTADRRLGSTLEEAHVDVLTIPT